MLKLLLIERRSPPVRRSSAAAELRRWVDSGAYTAVPRRRLPAARRTTPTRKVSEAAQEAARSYTEAFRQSQDAVTKLVRDAGGAFAVVRDWVGGQFATNGGPGTGKDADGPGA